MEPARSFDGECFGESRRFGFGVEIHYAPASIFGAKGKVVVRLRPPGVNLFDRGGSVFEPVRRGWRLGPNAAGKDRYASLGVGQGGKVQGAFQRLNSPLDGATVRRQSGESQMPPAKSPTKAEQREIDARKRVEEAWRLLQNEWKRKKPPRKIRRPPKETA